MNDQPGNLSAARKRQLLAELLEKKRRSPAPQSTESAAAREPGSTPDLAHAMAAIQQQKQWLKDMGEDNPFMRPLDGTAMPDVHYMGEPVVNFSTYNYLGFAGDARVNQAAAEAIERYGTSVGASRIASGERPIHEQLESTLAGLLGAEAALAFVSGYGANESVIGHIIGSGDLLLHDALMHRSALDGARLSGAQRHAFAHNDMDALERLLTEKRGRYGQCLILVEGLYSMDGDTVDLQRLVAIKQRFDALLLVDEAHSMGVLGNTGRGIGEHCGVDVEDVDLWMMTLSKSFASCGGAFAGKRGLIEFLRYSVPGFVFSVGLSPPNAAAALKAVQLMVEEPERVERIQANGRYFLEQCRKQGLKTGLSEGYAVTAIHVGSSEVAVHLSNALLEQGINVQPVLYPAVPENDARLRFFITAMHSQAQMDKAVRLTAERL